MKVHLRKKKLKDGSYSLLLDYFISGKRHREYLNIHIKGRGFRVNEKMELARTIAAQKEIELIHLSHGGVALHKTRTDFIPYYSEYIKNCGRTFTRNMTSSLDHLKKFAGSKLPANQITPEFCQNYRNHLGKNLHGETPSVYFSCFKQVLGQAVRDHLFLKSPAEGIKNPKPKHLRKEILSVKEIKRLNSVPCPNEEVKRAFLFACFTGLRFVDVKNLMWSDVDLDHMAAKVCQAKTGVYIFIPLNQSALSLLGRKGSGRVFTLPSGVATGVSLKKWTGRAAISKHITFHCARHTYGTLLLLHGNDLKTTSELLGHTTTRETEKYTHISSKMKRRAVNSLPELI